MNVEVSQVCVSRVQWGGWMSEWKRQWSPPTSKLYQSICFSCFYSIICRLTRQRRRLPFQLWIQFCWRIALFLRPFKLISFILSDRSLRINESIQSSCLDGLPISIWERESSPDRWQMNVFELIVFGGNLCGALFRWLWTRSSHFFELFERMSHQMKSAIWNQTSSVSVDWLSLLTCAVDKNEKPVNGGNFDS